MNKEAFETAKKLDQEILHISKVIDYLQNMSGSQIFITNEADDYVELNAVEADAVFVALANKRFILQQDFAEL